MRSAYAALALATLSLALGPGCDNPSCAFAGTCQDPDGNQAGDPGGLGTMGASFPSDGVFMSPDPPELVTTSAQLADARPRTPVFLEYSESLNQSTLSDAFQAFDPIFGQTFPLAPPLLTGNGRVVVLLPIAPYMDGQTIQIIYSDTQQITDLHGQALADTGNGVLYEMTISEAPDTDPRLFYAYPPDGSINQSDISEIVIGFDRLMDASTVDGDSISVTVGGVDPPVDPNFVPLTFGGLAQQRQIFVWRPVDGNGTLVPYGTDSNVLVTASPSGAIVVADDGGELPLTESEFDTTNFSVPSMVVKEATALPLDAFGSNDVFGGGPLVEVTFSSPVPANTRAEVYLTGRSPTNINLNRALARTIDVDEDAMSLTLTGEDLQLFDGNDNPQFEDGPFELAVQLRRNTTRTGIKRFDGDPTSEALDRPIFDTTAPMLLGLGATGAEVAFYIDDVRDMAVLGRASEEVSYAFVDAGAAGTNGGSLANPPEIAFSSMSPDADESLFIAAPIDLATIDSRTGVRFDLTIYDRAFNASATPVNAVYVHRGVIGPGGAPTGAEVMVRVIDQATFQPIEGALVFSHQEVGGAVTLNEVAMSDALGVAMVDGSMAGATVITVDAPGYDLFTFHGVPREVIDVPLQPTMGVSSTVSGVVSVTAMFNPFAVTQNRVSDSRFFSPTRLGEVMSCSQGQVLQFNCEYGPLTVRSNRHGVSSFVASAPAFVPGLFDPGDFLIGFALRGPLPPIEAGADALDIDLDAAGSLLVAELDERPLGVGTHGLANSAANLGTLMGDPLVTVEATAAGVDRPITVGRGLADEITAGLAWSVEAALAGVAGPTGDLSSRAAIDPDLFLRAELMDDTGNIVAARPHLSGSMGMLAPIDVPRFLSPGPGGMSGGPGYNLVVEDTLPDAAGGDGLTRVRLVDGNGRGWTLYGLDTNDGSGDLLISVPNIGADGGMGLAPGTVTADVTTWGADFDRGNFLWTDLEREYEQYGYAAPVTFTQN